MTITRADVADLQPGDVVEISWPSGTTLRGDLIEDNGGLRVADSFFLRYDTGHAAGFTPDSTLTVISRAPRPMYVNHPRTEPVPGDVVREEDPDGATTWLMDSFQTWQSKDSAHEQDRGFDWPLRLLVDGSTGQVVP